jgi:1,2-diacylglycerol 3-alpha-glucosyltransferase
MRILMVTNTYLPARNGVAATVGMYVRELRRRGHEVGVLTFRHPDRSKHEKGIYQVPAVLGVDRDFMVAPVAGLPSSLPRDGWDVVHVHHPVFLGPWGVRFGAGARARVVLTAHSEWPEYLDNYALGMGKPVKPWVRSRTSNLCNKCHVVLAPSSHVADELRAWGVTVPILRHEPAADTERIPPAPREEARAELGLEDERLAIYAGRVTPEKHVDELVDAFADAAQFVPQARLVIAGDGDRLVHALDRARERAMSDRVWHESRLDGRSLGLWYSAADVNVSCSRSETGPLTVVEAMACGTPSIGYRRPGFEDRISSGINGVLVDDEPREYAAALGAVLLDPKLQRRLAEGARASAPRYLVDSAVDHLLSVYEGADA